MSKRSRAAKGGRADGAGIKAAAVDDGGMISSGGKQDALGDFAEDLGRLLGTVQNRASGWLEQRKAITEQLTKIRDTADNYLKQLSGENPFPWGQGGQRKRRGRPPASASPQAPAEGARKGRRPGFRMSAEARARIAEAQRKRWAKHRKQQT